MTHKILITGANGQLGNEIKNLLGMVPTCSFMFTDREQLDLADSVKMRELFEKHRFAYCINTAAYTAVDKAETDIEKATEVNVKGVENLANLCHEFETVLLHISTDFVFDGTKSSWYNENDIPNPMSVYGKTKLDGENKIRKICYKYVIVRTAWLYSLYGNNFVKTILRLAKEKPELSIIADQTGTPTSARDLAKALMLIVQKFCDAKNSEEMANYYGIYHFSNEGTASWYDFAHSILSTVHATVPLKPIHTKQYPTPAQRPKFSVLDKTLIKNTFSLHIPHWQESLQKCIIELESLQ
jgi:dTDP-4-dehydrorhamnose reductase